MVEAVALLDDHPRVGWAVIPEPYRSIGIDPPRSIQLAPGED